MKTNAKLAASAFLAFNLVAAAVSFDDQYDAYSIWTPLPSTCLGIRTSTALGGGIAANLAGAGVKFGSMVIGFPGIIVGGLVGNMAYSIKKDREGRIETEIDGITKASHYCPPSLLQSKAYQP